MNLIKHPLIIFFPFLLFGFCLAGVSVAADPEKSRPKEYVKPDLAPRLGELTAAFQQTGRARVGVSVVDLRSGRVIFSCGESQALIPASNQKLLTSAFALARLGKNFQFATTVSKIGRSIIVTGDMDPTLGDPLLAKRKGRSIYHELDRWAKAVFEKCGPSIAGDLILQSQILPENYFNPNWKKVHRTQWYGAPVADLNFNDNCFDVTFIMRDGRIIPKLSPASRYIRVIDKTRPGNRQIWRLRSDENDSVVTISGTVRSVSHDPLSTAMADPPMVLGYVFADRLARAGVKISGGLRRIKAGKIDLRRAVKISQTRTDIFTAIARANKRSLNLAAECLFLRAGDKTWEGSARLMHRTLVSEFGLDPTGLTISDGGGLSRANRVSPKNMTTLLSAMITKPYGQEFLNSLSRSGQDGTLRKRLRARKYRGRIAGKTGYISGVVALSGYVLPAGDDNEKLKPAYAFSILLNNVRNVRKARQFQNRICKMLVDNIDNPNQTGNNP